MKRTEPQIIALEVQTLQGMLRRAEAKQFQDDDYETVQVLAQSYFYLTDLLKGKHISVRRLQKLLFGASTEKTSAVVGDGRQPESPPLPDEAAAETDRQDDSSAQRKGHGRNAADAYRSAEQIEVPHESLEPGDACPNCEKGTVYETSRPKVLVRIVGQPPVGAKVFRLQKLRCHLCGKVFTAAAPAGVGPQKYDATVASMIAILKYGSGMPFNRFAGLQGNLGIPLPASTQWDLVRAQSKPLEPAWVELLRQAARGDVVYNDDTTVKILEMMGKRARQNALLEEAAAAGSGKKPRTGLFTSGVVSTRHGRRIALFFSGRQHAGENLKEVLLERARALAPPIQMCDALSRNLPGELATIVAHCLAHGRRQFVDVAEHFPTACRHVLEALKVIYGNDAISRKRKLSPSARLRFHQAHSGPTMEALKMWLSRQFEDRLVEPNSTLGSGVAYMLKHWERLTLFLRVPGAPLDNNICERALKRAILHRKNALFFKTPNGARVGDLYMSLIHTCELNGANPFDYLTELERHADQLAANPQDWMPWNYRQTLAAFATPPTR